MIQVEAEMGELSAAIEVALDQSMQAGNTVHALRILGGTRCQPHEELSVVVAEPGYRFKKADPFVGMYGTDFTRTMNWDLAHITKLTKLPSIRAYAGMAPWPRENT